MRLVTKLMFQPMLLGCQCSVQFLHCPRSNTLCFRARSTCCARRCCVSGPSPCRTLHGSAARAGCVTSSAGCGTRRPYCGDRCWRPRGTSSVSLWTGGWRLIREVLGYRCGAAAEVHCGYQAGTTGMESRLYLGGYEFGISRHLVTDARCVGVFRLNHKQESSSWVQQRASISGVPDDSLSGCRIPRVRGRYS